MGMFSCYYFALVGAFPTRAECEKLGGCKKCRFYLEEPERRKGSNERQNGNKENDC